MSKEVRNNNNVVKKTECRVVSSAGGTISSEAMTTSTTKRKNGCCDRLEYELQHLGQGTTWLAILLGQFASAFLCASAVISVYLIDIYNICIPNAQNFSFYLVLATVFTTILACRPAERNLFPVLKTRGWKYFLVALCDAEANYLMVKAYQFTTLTSGQLLDCFAIPTVLSFSWLVLRIRFKVPHIFGVSIALFGLCCLVWADVEDGRPLGPGKDRFLGDMLCLGAAFLHGISNVAQEFVVKTFDVVEFLGMVGLFGSFVCGLQCMLFEYTSISSIEWVKVGGGTSITTTTALLIGYAGCQVALYMITANVMKFSGATAFNLNLLTADFYSLVLGIYLFRVKVHVLYFLSFVLVMTGVIVFSIKPTIIASHIYKSLTREHTTTVDLELMASSPSAVGLHFASNSLNELEVTVSGETRTLLKQKENGLSNGVSLNDNRHKSESSKLSTEECDVVLQTTSNNATTLSSSEKLSNGKCVNVNPKEAAC